MKFFICPSRKVFLRSTYNCLKPIHHFDCFLKITHFNNFSQKVYDQQLFIIIIDHGNDLHGVLWNQNYKNQAYLSFAFTFHCFDASFVNKLFTQFVKRTNCTKIGFHQKSCWQSIESTLWQSNGNASRTLSTLKTFEPNHPLTYIKFKHVQAFCLLRKPTKRGIKLGFSGKASSCPFFKKIF